MADVKITIACPVDGEVMTGTATIACDPSAASAEPCDLKLGGHFHLTSADPLVCSSGHVWMLEGGGIQLGRKE